MVPKNVGIRLIASIFILWAGLILAYYYQASSGFVALLGLWFMADSVCNILTKDSLLEQTYDSGKTLILIPYMVMGVVFGTMVELFGVGFGGLWNYLVEGLPNVVLIVLSWGLGLLACHSLFLIFSDLARRMGFSDRPSFGRNLIENSRLLIILIGLIFLFNPVVVYIAAGIYNLISFIINCLGVWLLVDAVDIMKEQPSLLYDILSLNICAIFAIILTPILIGTLMEFIGSFGGFWFYHPLQGSMAFIAFGMPLTVFIKWLSLTLIWISAHRFAGYLHN